LKAGLCFFRVCFMVLLLLNFCHFRSGTLS
jgi:hypothetical protein